MSQRALGELGNNGKTRRICNMNTSRRQFLGGAAASFFIGGCASKCAPRKVGPNEKVNVAIIGCGCIAKGTNVPGFLQDPRCRVTVACDMVKLAPDYFYGARGSNFGAEGFSASGLLEFKRLYIKLRPALVSSCLLRGRLLNR